MPQAGVRRQHAQLSGQLCEEAITAIELLGKFLRNLVAHGIADDHEDPAILALTEIAFYHPLEEALLRRHTVDLPVRQQTGAYEVVPALRQRLQESG